MAKRERDQEREVLLEELHSRFSDATSRRRRFTYYRKKICWIAIIQGALILKRVFDIIGALFLLIALSPLFLLIALIIKLSDRGPILYISKRVGLHGRIFSFPKFRSMVIDAEIKQEQLQYLNEHHDPRLFKIKKDPRITKLGAFLRKSSLDELPQLWSILIGDLSFVGPRPPTPSEVALYSIENRKRLEIKPGLTCISQIKGRSDLPFDQQVRLDRQYIESQSFWGDFKLLLKTIPVVLLGKGAY